jgi:hypothetical protein
MDWASLWSTHPIFNRELHPFLPNLLPFLFIKPGANHFDNHAGKQGIDSSDIAKTGSPLRQKTEASCNLFPIFLYFWGS